LHPAALLRSTLFPYTTLFRSNECLPCLHDAQCPLKRCEKLIRLLARQAIARRRVVVDKHDERLTQGLGRSLFWIVLYAKASHIRDRKSTRLNSSHRTNSYTVF